MPKPSKAMAVPGTATYQAGRTEQLTRQVLAGFDAAARSARRSSGQDAESEPERTPILGVERRF